MWHSLFILLLGTKTIINVLSKNIDLCSIGFSDEPFENYLKQEVNFFLHCYSQIKVETLNDSQKKMWKYSVATDDIYLYGWEKEG